MYTSVHEKAVSRLGNAGPGAADEMFVVNTNRNHTATNAQLEAKCKQFKANEDAANAQKTLEKMGDTYGQQGDYQQAIRQYEESNSQFRQNNEGFLRVANKIIQCSVDSGSFADVARACHQIRKLDDRKDGKALLQGDSKAHAHHLIAGALSSMKDFNSLSGAAQRLYNAPILGISSPATLLSAADLCNYVCLIALAFFSRQELAAVLQSFKKYLEVRPVWAVIIDNYQSCSFAAVFTALEAMKKDLQLDIYIGRHVPRLFALIKNNAMINYFKPFNALRIPHIAQVFDMKEDEMEQKLINLIAEDKVMARIDSANKVIYARSSSARNEAYEKAFEMGDRYTTDAKSLILSLSLSKHNFAVKPPPKRSEEGHKTMMMGMGGFLG